MYIYLHVSKNIYVYCIHIWTYTYMYIDISGKIFLKKTPPKKTRPIYFCSKITDPHEKKKHRPPAARQQKHSLHHKAVRHPSADSPRHAARHHSLCPCHVTPGPSKTAWGEVEFPTFLPHQKGTKHFWRDESSCEFVAWKNTPRKSLIFKSWFLGESFVLQFLKLSFCEKIVDSHTCTSYIQKKNRTSACHSSYGS